MHILFHHISVMVVAVSGLVLVQKKLVVRAPRLRMQPGRPHHKNAELMLDRYLRLHHHCFTRQVVQPGLDQGGLIGVAIDLAEGI